VIFSTFWQFEPHFLIKKTCKGSENREVRYQGHETIENKILQLQQTLTLNVLWVQVPAQDKSAIDGISIISNDKRCCAVKLSYCEGPYSGVSEKTLPRIYMRFEGKFAIVLNFQLLLETNSLPYWILWSFSLLFMFVLRRPAKSDLLAEGLIKFWYSGHWICFVPAFAWLKADTQQDIC